MQLEPNLLPSQDVRLVVKGDNMATMQLFFIVTTKRRFIYLILDQQARMETPHYHHQLFLGSNIVL